MEDSFAACVCCELTVLLFCSIPAVIPAPYTSTLHTWAGHTTTHAYSFYICMQGVPIRFCWTFPQWSLQATILLSTPCSLAMTFSPVLLALGIVCILRLSYQLLLTLWIAGRCLLVSPSFWSCAKWFVIWLNASGHDVHIYICTRVPTAHRDICTQYKEAPTAPSCKAK